MLVVITSPRGAVSADASAEPGIQVDVTASSNLRAGDTITLIVEDAGGNQVSTHTAQAGQDGNAQFKAITLPEGKVTLSVTGDAGECGESTDSVQIDVFTRGCLPSSLVSPDPTQNEAITGDKNGDPDDGLQADIRVQVDPTCSAKTLKVECPTDTQTADVPVNGTVDLELKLSDAAREDRTVQCTATVTDVDDFETATVLPIPVDNVGPDVKSFAAVSPNRQSVQLSWDAPDDNGSAAKKYIIKMAEEAIDESNFDTVGTEVTGLPAPAGAGTSQSHVIGSLKAGTEYFFAMANIDARDNRSVLATLGPVTPDFDQIATVSTPGNPDPNDSLYGYQVVRGDFNNDQISDIAIGAPDRDVGALDTAGSVYVYFGSKPGGLGSTVTPDLVIEGTENLARFGYGLAVLDWNGDTLDDLAVGQWGGLSFQGGVSIYLGGSNFVGTGMKTSAQGDVTITAGTGFTGNAMGASLTAARFNTDSRDDLVLAVYCFSETPPANFDCGDGAIAVVYGGSTASQITLDTGNAGLANGARIRVIKNPQTISGAGADIGFGDSMFNLGRTEGTGDLNDDIAVTYYDGPSVYVIRGRDQPSGDGVTVDANGVDLTSDLEITHGAGFSTSLYLGSAMASIADVNDDQARDIVVGQWGPGRDETDNPHTGSNLGQVFIIDGDATGTVNVTSDALTTIASVDPLERRFGTAIANNALARTAPDVDGDGTEDLLIVGGDGTGKVRMHIWYDVTTIPAGSVEAASSNHTFFAPAEFLAEVPATNNGSTVRAIWAGDVNGDGLEDICWGDSTVGTTQRHGGFSLLWDDPTLL